MAPSFYLNAGTIRKSLKNSPVLYHRDTLCNKLTQSFG